LPGHGVLQGNRDRYVADLDGFQNPQQALERTLGFSTYIALIPRMGSCSC
jgi:hypothetical protein